MRPDLLALHFLVALSGAARRAAGGARERGDVPGWVMVTIMSAGLVVAILVAARGPIVSAVTDAIANVTAESGNTGP